MPDSSDTKPVRESEQLNWETLERYTRSKLGVVLSKEPDSTAAMVVEQFPGGHSNLTYLLRFDSLEFVLRRPPFGPVPARAHDMAREYRILEALHPVFPLAPRPLALCEDPSVIGSTFYLMERRYGEVVRGHEPQGLADNPAVRRLVSEAMVDALAELHSVDIDSSGLAAFGKAAGFVTRQVQGWTDRWHGSQTTELPQMDGLASWLAERIPPDSAHPTMVHGDFKLDNVMLNLSANRKIVGVFDWEMSAIGDPLVDLGIMLAYWVHTATPSESDALSPVTNRPGWFTRTELLERYNARTGLDLANIAFYEVFAVFKLAVVLQQIFFRYRRGQTDDARFATLDGRVTWLASVASTLAEQARD